MLASLGDFEFSVSAQNIRTFNSLKFSHSASFTEHKILNSKGLLEFTNLSSSTCSLNIHLNKILTIDIPGIVSYFREQLNEANALAFIIGEQVIGEGLWVIESLDEDYKYISNTGEIYEADLALKLKEYIE